MGFLPFINEGGRRVVRWPRLVLAWLAVVSACVLGAGGASYALTGGWWPGVSAGIALGLFYSAGLTVHGLTVPVKQLPPTR
jgi:CHASE2 domain-containing sensor protein